MSIEQIPAQTVMRCDRCTCVMNKQNARLEASLTTRYARLDHAGFPVTGGTNKFDLCDGCFSHMETRIKSTLEDRL
jgi:hypothetical protein